jgi:predicted AlkP superfamily pyrophosphatase or phosphodiesterase
LKSSVATLSLLSTLCLPQLQAQATNAATSKAIQHPPRLVVAIIVDQFRFDYTTRFASRYTGGLHTMLTGGAVFVDAHQDHYPTVTATGHATFMTGSTPATSGIIGNEWFDRAQGRSITSVEDADTKLLGGKPGATGSSPHNLIVSTLGDELKIADRNTTRVIGISMKDRAAILPAGRMADAAYWIDDTTGAFVSSTWYQPALPSWVASFNEGKPAQCFLGKSWFGPGAEQKGAKPFVTLPREAGKAYIGAFETTPWSNEMLEEFAEQAIQHEELGHHNGTDLLTISFSANDHLGHAVGPDDPSVEELAVRTDQTIGKLIAAAEKQVGGPQNVLVVMSADHGVAPVPEINVARKMPGGRVDKAAYTHAVQDALDTKFGKARWIIGSWESGFYFDENLIRERKLSPSDVEDEAARAIAGLPYVERTYTRTQLMNRQAMASLADDYVARSFFPARGPDLFVIFKPYWLFGKEGTSHGSPWDYDTHVPLLFLGAGIQPGVYTERVGISDVAPTLAALLHVEAPSGNVGHILREIVAPSRLPPSVSSSRGR